MMVICDLFMFSDIGSGSASIDILHVVGRHYLQLLGHCGTGKVWRTERWILCGRKGGHYYVWCHLENYIQIGVCLASGSDSSLREYPHCAVWQQGGCEGSKSEAATHYFPPKETEYPVLWYFSEIQLQFRETISVDHQETYRVFHVYFVLQSPLCSIPLSLCLISMNDLQFFQESKCEIRSRTGIGTKGFEYGSETGGGDEQTIEIGCGSATTGRWWVISYRRIQEKEREEGFIANV